MIKKIVMSGLILLILSSSLILVPDCDGRIRKWTDGDEIENAGN